MPEIDDASATAKVLVESFEVADNAAARNAATEAAAGAPTPPTMPRDDLGLPMWPSPPPPLDPLSLARWHVSFKGLHWRVNNRLFHPSLERSLQSSLMRQAIIIGSKNEWVETLRWTPPPGIEELLAQSAKLGSP